VFETVKAYSPSLKMPDRRIDHDHPRSYARRTLRVLKAWIKQPSQVATICPSSPQLLRVLTERACVRDADRVIELGPGEGGTTVALLRQMKPQSRLLAIEKTRELAETLDTIEDPRLVAHCGDAADLCSIANRYGWDAIDVVVSGIPFSILPEAVAGQIVQAIDQLLRPGGTFIAYQVQDDVSDYAQPCFGTPTLQSVPLNLPPLKVYCWTKSEQRSDPQPTAC
jgi:phospholipid N-methyltransferase